ncbi:hypothetical protein [Mycolicibacterium rhodesiae]|uniref:Transmembrane protein n=1 Tax=Mycolicibacterium rhodesiae TaxID=36814 RepID=A0A1X0IQZ0_MYCRH|nr:hypothetical protein [Mycolicibacterium rhodesiae]MCV7343658.1 hypothetical protein [Mycolicibacterium rhodesiae]ORB50902.1 hypothetical protein BST42_19305 [Mycolicibacterium rhodesiae]
MGRVTATALQLLLWVLAGALYFLFVLPRWWELMGDTTHTLGTVARIVTGVLIALAALPVLLTLLRSRKPEAGTPQLALRLRLWSVILHVLAGVLIVGTAVAEIWISLDKGGPWLFGIYGAAAAIAVLALLSFQLAYTAELPPKPAKPKKEKKVKKKRGKAADDAEETTEVTEAAEATEAADSATSEDSSEPAVEDEQPAEVSADASAEAEPEVEPAPADGVDSEPAGALRNKRPTGKTNHRLRRRNRTNIAVDE